MMVYFESYQMLLTLCLSHFSDRMGDSRGKREKWQTEKDMAEELK